MKNIFFFLLFILSGAEGPLSAFSQDAKRKEYTTTLTYPQIISAYEGFAKQSPYVKLLACGPTDIGKPLHLFVISKSKEFDPEVLRKNNKRVLLINNGIHPGEPDGIDASIELVQKLLKQPELIPDNVAICIIPVYNVDGCLNRGKYSRANQNGPEEYGFRGNAQNLDLNRDFVKADSKNAQSFIEIFQKWKPDVFVDTHTSDGADYQYVMTLIATQKDKLHPALSGFMVKEMLPVLYEKMKARRYEMSPYVDTYKETPDSGLVGFLETPRFSTGYAAQFNCIGFVTEAHMWKPYNDRVWATYEFLWSLIETSQQFSEKIGTLKKQADEVVKVQKGFVLNWKLDTGMFTQIEFKGYEAVHRISTISRQEALFYDRIKPFTKKIRYYDHYKPAASAGKPDAYIIPQAWDRVIDRLKMSGVKMKQLTSDTTITGQVYYITGYETSKNPYEGHYVHYNTTLRTDTQALNFYKGDYVVTMDQTANRYIAETLEPGCDDSFFAWGFFDAILQQKEWFSDYVFEEKAEQLLMADPKLKAQLEEKKKTDPAFAASRQAQLGFIYRKSVYYERSHNRYPVMRIDSLRK